MLRDFLNSSPPQKRTIILKAIFLLGIVIVVFIGQFFLPHDPLPRAQSFVPIESQILGALSIPTPAPPLEKFKSLINNKVASTKEAIASKGAMIAHDFSESMKEKTISTRSTLESYLLLLYMKGIDRSLPNLLPQDKEVIIEKLQNFTLSPTSSPSPSLSPTSF